MYRDKALDTFIRGLRGDLPRLLAIKEPADLPSALHYCLKLENQTYRSNHAENKGQQSGFRVNEKPTGTPHFSAVECLWPSTASTGPSTKPHEETTTTHRPAIRCWQRMLNFGNAPFAAPRRNYQQQWQPNNAPPCPFATKPQPRPEPMDVDPHIQTRNVSGQITDINKRQRNYNIQTMGKEQPSVEMAPWTNIATD